VGTRVAIIGGGLLGTTLALRYRQAGRVVTVFEADERVDRRMPAPVCIRDRSFLTLIEELGLSSSVRWEKSVPREFGVLVGGRARIVESLRDRARAIGVDFRLGVPVQSISPDGLGFGVATTEGVTEFDEVVMTVSSATAADLVETFPEQQRLMLHAVESLGIISVSFVIRSEASRAGSKHYVSHVVRGHFRFAVLDFSCLIADKDIRQDVVYVSRPLAMTDKFFSEDDRVIIEHFARALAGDVEIVKARVTRTPHAFARQSLGSFTSSIPGLSIVNAATMNGGRHHLDRTAAVAASAFQSLCAERIS